MSLYRTGGFQSVIPRAAISASPANLLQMQIPDTIPDWDWSPAI